MYGSLQRVEASHSVAHGIPNLLRSGAQPYMQEGQWGNVTTTSILLAAGIEVRVKGARDLMHL